MDKISRLVPSAERRTLSRKVAALFSGRVGPRGHWDIETPPRLLEAAL
ncbi:MAG TPA: hypothetical protein VEO55_06175 [Candidatus Dormibacteraeota bacterium]|nr:hypothetical protein [Candidatus Dormibacteraeota bacterium]